MKRGNADLPATLYLGLVLVPLIVQIGARMLDPANVWYERVFNGEMGVVELGTLVLLLAASILLAIEARRQFRRGEKTTGLLLAVLAVGAFVFMGEEASWGQWFFQWSSPEWFQEHNLQGETNLHNLGFVKKNVAKWSVIGGIGLFGVLLVFRDPPKSGRLGPFDARILPTMASFPTAVVVVASHLGAKLLFLFWGLNDEEFTGIDIREATEFYVAMFGFIYALSLRQRFGTPESPAATQRQFVDSRHYPANPAE